MKNFIDKLWDDYPIRVSAGICSVSSGVIFYIKENPSEYILWVLLGSIILFLISFLIVWILSLFVLEIYLISTLIQKLNISLFGDALVIIFKMVIVYFILNFFYQIRLGNKADKCK